MKTKSPTLLTGAQYAKHLGVSPARVCHLVKKGVLQQDEEGRFDRDLNDRLMAQAQDPAYQAKQKASPHPSNGKAAKIPMTFGEAKTERETYLAKQAKLDYYKAIGKVVLADTVNKRAFEVGRRVREQLFTIPNRIAGVLAAETDQEKVYQVLMGELQQALEALTEGQESHAA